MRIDTEEATCFTAGIIKGLKENGDAYRHFGSLMNFQYHQSVAAHLGLIEIEPRRLTPEGHVYYARKGLVDLPDGRAYMWPAKDWRWPEPQTTETTPEAA